MDTPDLDLDSIIAALQQYSACDVSDALLKLNIPGAGFLPDLIPFSPGPSQKADTGPTVAPVSTVLFAIKGQGHLPGIVEPNIPDGQHWADNTPPGTIVVISQPEGQTNAVCGGIMALRMKVRDAGGIVVSGRVRDLAELRSTGLPIWARGSSTVGSGGGSSPWALQVPLEIKGMTISPGDIAMCDPENGVVVIPRENAGRVVEMLPAMMAADEKIVSEVRQGAKISEAFARHR